MAESVTRHGPNHSSNDEPEVERDEQNGVELDEGRHRNDGQDEQEQTQTTSPATMAATHGGIIWTPKFIVLFALVLTIGLSAESLLTQGWINGYYRAIWVLFGHLAILLGLWISAVVVAHSGWVRMGAIFGCVWAIFSTINLVTSLFNFDLHTSIPAYLNAAFSCALLGAYICFSVARTELHSWDMWFFRLAIICGGIFVLVELLVVPPSMRTPGVVANAVGTIATILCMLVWWLRPVCWRTHAGLTFLLGASPAIVLFLSLPGIVNIRVNFFITELSLFCLILGLIRLIQGENIQRRSHMSDV
jgi:hypothetical protein